MLLLTPRVTVSTRFGRPSRLPPARATSHAAATRFWPAGSVRHVATGPPVRQRRGTVQYSEHQSLGKSPSTAPRSVVVCCFVFPELVRARGAARPDRSLSEQVRAAAQPTPLRPHRLRDWARHICTGTGPRRCHICTGTAWAAATCMRRVVCCAVCRTQAPIMRIRVVAMRIRVVAMRIRVLAMRISE